MMVRIASGRAVIDTARVVALEEEDFEDTPLSGDTYVAYHVWFDIDITALQGSAADRRRITVDREDYENILRVLERERGLA